MKKMKSLGVVLALSVVTLLGACQKGQEGVTTNESAAVKSGNENITAIQVSASNIPGIINNDDASSMAAEYVNKFGGKSTQYVSFNVKDLQAYLNYLKSQGSQKIYVNFGVYNDKTATPGNAGKLTVFFTGDKRSKGNGSVGSNDVFDDSEALNHGGIFP